MIAKAPAAAAMKKARSTIYAAADGGCDADFESDNVNETTKTSLEFSRQFQAPAALKEAAVARGTGLLNLGRGRFHLFDHAGRKRNIAHAIGYLLSIRQAIGDELSQVVGLFRVLLLVEKLPSEG